MHEVLFSKQPIDAGQGRPGALVLSHVRHGRMLSKRFVGDTAASLTLSWRLLCLGAGLCCAAAE